MHWLWGVIFTIAWVSFILPSSFYLNSEIGYALSVIILPVALFFPLIYNLCKVKNK
jgi:hypothetical protein